MVEEVEEVEVRVVEVEAGTNLSSIEGLGAPVDGAPVVHGPLVGLHGGVVEGGGRPLLRVRLHHVRPVLLHPLQVVDHVHVLALAQPALQVLQAPRQRLLHVEDEVEGEGAAEAAEDGPDPEHPVEGEPVDHEGGAEGARGVERPVVAGEGGHVGQPDGHTRLHRGGGPGGVRRCHEVP